MESRSYIRNVRISPSKVKIVCDLIRGKSAAEAAAILRFTPKSASTPLSAVLKNAVANAENNYEMDVEKLYISEVFACPGAIMKRVMPRAKGRADRINKRTSHITLAVKEKDAE